MPFRYIIGSDNKPVMPKVLLSVMIFVNLITDVYVQGMIELIKQDAEKGFADLL